MVPTAAQLHMWLKWEGEGAISHSKKPSCEKEKTLLKTKELVIKFSDCKLFFPC